MVLGGRDWKKALLNFSTAIFSNLKGMIAPGEDGSVREFFSLLSDGTAGSERENPTGTGADCSASRAEHYQSSTLSI